MRLHARRKWAVLGGCVALVLAVGLIVPALEPNVVVRWERFYCQRCGLCREIQEERDPASGALRAQRVTLHQTPLAQWYETHYPTPCDHRWDPNHFSRRGYRTLGSYRLPTGSGENGGHIEPAFVRPDDAARADLDRRYAQDPAACQQHIIDEMTRWIPSRSIP
jgi:hypothetical protein